MTNQNAHGWTLFDLRGLRKSYFGPDEIELERIVFGYDFIVLIPNAKASTQIQ